MNTISISLLLLMLVPLFLFAWIKNIIYFYLLLAVIIVTCTTAILKYIFAIISDNPVFYRPKGAEHCSVWNDKCCPYAPAFPSGHMSVSTFLAITLVLILYPSSIIAWFVAISYIVVMGASRYMKQCHNLPQITAGVIYGLICVWIFASMIDMLE